eukprot:scaffold13191_cov178-Amphora_coffeaeformis.AAC.6
MSTNESSSTVPAFYENPHRIVAESDFQALQGVWQRETVQGNNTNLLTSVDAAVWELLVKMVNPIPDRTYEEHTSANPPEEVITTVLPPEETWEAWVDSSALERVRQLRAQVRQKSASVQEKKSKVLTQIETFLQHQKQLKQSSSTAAPKPPPLAPSVQQMCTAKVQQTQGQVESLVCEMDDLHVKIPDVVQHFHETLATVQDEERQRQAERAIRVSPDDVCMMMTQESAEENEENKAPAEERLLRFLTTQ